MKKLAIIGSSDLAKLIIHQVFESKQYEIYGIYDDFTVSGTLISGVAIKGKLDKINKDFNKNKFDMLFIAVGYSRMDYRADVFNRFKNIIPFANIIHKSCIIDSTVELGQGNLLLPGVLLDKGVKIKNNVLLNVGVTIAHDSTIDNHCFLAPSVTIAGFSHVGPKCYIGTNATIIDNIKICSSVILGAGAVTVKDINEKGIYVGVPSEKLKSHLK